MNGLKHYFRLKNLDLNPAGSHVLHGTVAKVKR